MHVKGKGSAPIHFLEKLKISLDTICLEDIIYEIFVKLLDQEAW